MGFRRLRVTAPAGLTIAIVALVLYAVLVLSGDFLSSATLSTLTPLLAVAVILAIGQAMVIGTGGIDLSIPYTMTLVGSIMLYVSDNDAGRVPQAIAISLLACVVVGLVNGILVEGFGLNALVATLAVGMVVAGITRLYRGPVDTVTSVPERMQSWARTNGAGFSALLIVAVGLVALLVFYTFKTGPGRRLVASSASPRTAYLMGIRATTFRIVAYVVAAVLYGIGAITLSGLLGSPDLTFGNAFQLPPIVAVVLGGAALGGGRISYVATGLGAIVVTLLDYELRVAGYTSGVSQLVQGLVLAVGLAGIYLVKRRAATRPSGNNAGLPAPQALGATEG